MFAKKEEKKVVKDDGTSLRLQNWARICLASMILYIYIHIIILSLPFIR